MKKDKSIITQNNKGQFHGYQELHRTTKLWYRGIFNNGIEIGYEERHIAKNTNYYIR
jgi:hypothetical protein